MSATARTRSSSRTEMHPDNGAGGATTGIKRATRTLKEGSVIVLPYTRPSRFGGRRQTSCNQCRKRKTKCDLAKPCSSCVGKGAAKKCSLLEEPENKELLGRNSLDRRDSSASEPSSSSSSGSDSPPEAFSILHHPNHPSDVQSQHFQSSPSSSESSLSPCAFSFPSPIPAPLSPPDLHPGPVETSSDTIFSTSNLCGVLASSLLSDALLASGNIQQTSSSEEPLQLGSLGAPRCPSPTDLVSFTTDLHAILTTLPTPAQAQIALAAYFEIVDPSVHGLHRPTFLRRAQKFWDWHGDVLNLTGPDLELQWMACYLVACGLGLLTMPKGLSEQVGFPAEEESGILARSWIDSAMKTLLISNFTGCPTLDGFAAIVLLFEYWLSYSDGRHLRAAEKLFSATVTAVFDFQLNHDPSRIANSTEAGGKDLEMELRRRLYWSLFSIDALLASIKDSSRLNMSFGSKDDPFPPSEIADEDFDFRGRILPTVAPSSPISPASPNVMTAVNVRSSICVVLHKMARTIFSQDQASYRYLVGLLGELDQIWGQILLWRAFLDPVKASQSESAYNDNVRLVSYAYVRLLRPFLSMEHPDPASVELEKNRDTCIRFARLLISTYDSSGSCASFLGTHLPLTGAIALAVDVCQRPHRLESQSLRYELQVFLNTVEFSTPSALRQKSIDFLRTLLQADSPTVAAATLP